MSWLFWYRAFVDDEVAVALLVLASLALLVAGLVRVVHVRRGRELVRRRLLAQLELAARRGYPLGPAVEALAQELEARLRPTGRLWVSLAVPPLGLFRAVRWALNRNRADDAEAARDVATVLREGDLRRALAAAPEAFPEPWPRLLGTAERSGALVATLAAAGDIGAEGERFRGDVRGRLVYPVAVLLVVEVVAVAVSFATFDERLAEMGGPLTRAIVAARPCLMVGVPVFLAGLWLAAGALVPGEGVVARALRRLPWLARAHELAGIALLARTVGAFLRAGAPLPEALRGADERLEGAARRADEGASVADAFAAEGVLPGAAQRLLEVSGAPTDAFAALATWAANEHRGRVEALARVVLPVGLVAIALLVASVYWPPFLAINHFSYAPEGAFAPW